jgi:hypothetical protein
MPPAPSIGRRGKIYVIEAHYNSFKTNIQQLKLQASRLGTGVGAAGAA